MKPYSCIFMFLSMSLICNNAFPQEGLDTLMHSKQLQEIVAQGNYIVNKGEYQLLFLSKTDREFGSNALDAISSHPMFSTSLNGTSLVSWDRQQVFILINGIPSDGQELRTYKADDIKNVEYYQIAPPQYSIFSSGPIANVIVKRKVDRFYSGYFNANNAVNTGFGTNQADLAYRDSLNQVKIGYWGDYRDINNIRKHSYYDYGDMKTSYNGTDNKSNGNYHKFTGAYQRYQGKHLFNAKIGYIYDNGSQNEPAKSTIETTDGVFYGESETSLKSSSRSLSADLYYCYRINNMKYIAFNVVNTFANATSDSRIWLNQPAPFDDMNYDNSSAIKNNTYSLVANVAFVSPLWGGNFSLGDSYSHLRLKQKSAGIEYTPVKNTNTLYAAVVWRIKNISTLYPMIGFHVINNNNGTKETTNIQPYFNMYYDWWPSALKGFSIQATATINTGIPSLGQLTESATYLDRRFLSIGNAGLKDFWSGQMKLVIAYFKPNSRNNIQLVVRPRYFHKPYASILYSAGENVYLQPRNIGDIFRNAVYLRAVWNPVSWLEFDPYFECLTSHYDTPSKRVRENYLRVGGSVTFRLKNFNASFSYNTPTEEYEGDLIRHGSTQWVVDAQYKYRNWTFGAMYSYLGVNDYTSGNIADFSYLERKDWKPLRNLVRLNISYSFSIGKARKHDRKFLNNESFDNGLTDRNKVKMM